jgi:hypothetical protein
LFERGWQGQLDKIDVLYLYTADRATPFTETLGEINKLYQDSRSMNSLGLAFWWKVNLQPNFHTQLVIVKWQLLR